MYILYVGINDKEIVDRMYSSVCWP